MASPLTTENELILACARTDPDLRRIQDLADRAPDWEAVVRKAEQCRLVPLVYVALRHAAQAGRVPKPILERLRQLYHLEATYGIAQRAVLHASLVRFAEARVSVMVLKGMAVAALVYPSPTLRPTRSIDLLVHERDRDEVDALVRGIRDASGSSAASACARIDVCHHIADRAAAAHRIPIERVWEQARPTCIESVATLVPSHEHLLLQLALGIATRVSEPDGFVDQARTLCDVGETCRRYGNAIDWRGLVGQAVACGVATELHHSLRLARELVGADVPSDVLEDLRVRFGELPLEDPFTTTVAPRAIGSEGDASDAPREAHVSEPPSSGGPHPFGASGPSARTVGEVAVTYDPTTTDGVGSQLFRIYGLYALSRALHLKYVHTPIELVGYQGFLPLLTGRADPDFTARYNAFFSLPSDEFDLESCERVRIHVLGKDAVERHREDAAATGRPVLLQAIHHYGYTDDDPAAFHALRAVSPYRGHRPSGPVRVCIHLRRGDNSVPNRTDRGEQRLLPNGYYLRVCDVVLDALRRQGASFVVRLHTEVPPRRYTLYPDTPGLYFWLDNPATVDPADYTLDDFEALPNIEKVINVEAREALDDFATADVLILSRSSLGYLGGLLNPHGLVVYAPWWHSALPEWLVADEHGNLDAAQVSTRIADHLQRRRAIS